MRLVKSARNSLRWTARLESLRRRVRRLFSKGRRDRTLQSWELYREAQQEYRREVQRASKETWRTFCTSINELPRAARLHRALSKDPKVRLGSLVTPTGQRTQSEGETLDILLRTHFPGSRAVEEEVTVNYSRATRRDWREMARVVTYRRDLCPIQEPRSGWGLSSPSTRGTGGPCPLPG
jgi:hypothetical protein